MAVYGNELKLEDTKAENLDLDSQSVNYSNFQIVDSITYQLYLTAKWTELIKIAKIAENKQLDFKRLRQRTGYAYFISGDYYSAMAEYEAALTFDKSDLDTRLYLYYCGLYTANETYANYEADFQTYETKKLLGIKSFKIVDAIDFEYNFKVNDSQLRSNSTYYRLGISTKINNKISLYQSVSSYSQKLDSIGTQYNYLNRSHVTQNEYYGCLTWKPSSKFDILLAYHSISTKSIDSISYTIPLINVSKTDTISQSENMIFGKIAFKVNRFDFGLSSSFLFNNTNFIQQYELQAGVTLPGTLILKLKSSFDVLIENNKGRLIYSQKIGFVPIKKVWIEGNVTFGDLNNFADMNGLYILNSKDHTVFKTGITCFWNALNKVTLFANYGYDTKQLTGINNTIINYNQHSFSGGIIWKI